MVSDNNLYINKDLNEICRLDINIYKCISDKIDTERVVLTNKSSIHISSCHPDSFAQVLSELSSTIACPDYIIRDNTHKDTGLIIRKTNSNSESITHNFIVLKICTNTENGKYANSILSGWIISEKRLQSYLRNREILYKKD